MYEANIKWVVDASDWAKIKNMFVLTITEL